MTVAHTAETSLWHALFGHRPSRPVRGIQTWPHSQHIAARRAGDGGELRKFDLTGAVELWIDTEDEGFLPLLFMLRPYQSPVTDIRTGRVFSSSAYPQIVVIAPGRVVPARTYQIAVLSHIALPHRLRVSLDHTVVNGRGYISGFCCCRCFGFCSLTGGFFACFCRQKRRFSDF